jgi:virginiamycin B lyase
MSHFKASLTVAALVALAPVSAHAQAQKAALPEGDGKLLVEGLCVSCHQTNMITNSSGYTREGWKELFSTMIDLSGNPQEQAAIAAYLGQHFPPNTKHAPKLVSGTVQLTFKEYVVPTLGQRSRDPVEGPNGEIWWVGQWGNLVGRLDPKTGAMKEWTLPVNSRPHTVTPDSKGNAWFTGNTNGTVGYLDPNTGKTTVYKMPDPNAKDPHTLIFDRKGIAWFTLQNSNMVGRLDPATGDIKLVTVERKGAKPYGIKEDADGVLWISCNGSDCLLKMDPATMAITEIPLPMKGTTVRRLDIAENGLIYYTNSSHGRIGQYNPKTGEIKEWPSPSGPKSHPYGIVVVDNVVWYNESAMRPDPLVRFDPKTETFQSWAIPSGGVFSGILRHPRADREGNIWIHQSATNRIIKVSVERKAASR